MVLFVSRLENKIPRAAFLLPDQGQIRVSFPVLPAIVNCLLRTDICRGK